MQKLSAYNLAQNNNCGLITCSICGRSYRITEFGTDADCQSKRSNYAYFCRLFDVKALSASDMSMAEDLVLWNTVFEDRDILRRKILKTYGDLLTEKAVDDFCHKHLSGWGKLSERLLTGIWADTASGDMCVMDVLEQGRP